MREPDRDFGDDDRADADGDTPLEDIDWDATAALQRRMDEARSIDDDDERQVAIRKVIHDMGGVIR